MKVSGIEIWRDGGTVTFTIGDAGPLTGKYRLQTPFQGIPRPLFAGERKLRRGGGEEKALLDALRTWYSATVTAELAEALRRLDALREWRNLPADLAAAAPFHRMRTVIECLAERAS